MLVLWILKYILNVFSETTKTGSEFSFLIIVEHENMPTSKAKQKTKTIIRVN